MSTKLETRVAFTDPKDKDSIAVYPLDKFTRKFGKEVTHVVDGKQVTETVVDEDKAPEIAAQQVFSFGYVGETEDPIAWFQQFVSDVTVQRDLINRAVILKQQQKSIRLLTDDEFTTSDQPYDLSQHLNEAAERSVMDPKAKALRAVGKTFGLSPELLAQLSEIIGGMTSGGEVGVGPEVAEEVDA